MKKFGTFLLLLGVLTVAVSCDDQSDESHFEKPCENSDDMIKCVRSYFQKHSSCKEIKEPRGDDPVDFKGTHNTYVPKINLTIALKDTTLSGLTGNIEKFYINKKTNNLVLAVNFKGIHLDSKSANFIISQRGKEPKVIVERAAGTYPVILTMVLPLDKLTPEGVKNSMITAYIPEKLVKFYIGPKVTLNPDPVVQSVVLSLLFNIPTVLQEIFLTGAPNFFVVYMEENICNFGIPYEAL